MVRHSQNPRGLTLLELVVVLVILVALAAIVVPLAGNLVGDSREDVTRQSLKEIRNVIANMYWDDMYESLPWPDQAVIDAGQRANHPQLCFLLVNPETYQDENAGTADDQQTFDPNYRRGWRGPYLTPRQGSTYGIDASRGFSNYYGENGDPGIFDAWGNPIVIQNPGLSPNGNEDVRIVSAGPDGELHIPRTTATTALSDAVIDDDVWVAFELRR
jgi:prepilin-type N-terminal cleavage/methylation domain-containing protein